jgi:hypothetical protein
MNKFLHEPSVRLKAAAANGRGLGVVDAARYLFALENRVNSNSALENKPSSALEREDGPRARLASGKPHSEPENRDSPD